MKKKMIGLLLYSIMLGGIFTGCQRENILTESWKENTKDKKVYFEKPSNDGLITIGFTQVGAESDWRLANTESMKSALSKENGFHLIIEDAQQKQENQTKAVRDFISQQVDIIVIAPVTETGWETVLGEAKDARIPVILVDRMINVTDESLYNCWVGSDFEKEGVNSANWLVNHMEQQGKGEEEHKVVILQGTLGSSAEIGRTKGFNEVIKKHKNYKILEQQTGDFTQAQGQVVMESLLKKYDDIDVVIAQNDNMAFGAIHAIKAAGKKPGKDVVVVSFDAVKAAFEAMIAGELNVSIECNPLHGPRVAVLAKKIMKGEAVDKIQYVEEGIYPAESAERELPNRLY